MTNFPPPPDYDRAVGATSPRRALPPPARLPAPHQSSTGKRSSACSPLLASSLGARRRRLPDRPERRTRRRPRSSGITQPSANRRRTVRSNGSSGNGCASNGYRSGTAASTLQRHRRQGRHVDREHQHHPRRGRGRRHRHRRSRRRASSSPTTTSSPAPTSSRSRSAATGKTHPAKVLGYDIVDDVALVQIEGVSGLDGRRRSATRRGRRSATRSSPRQRRRQGRCADASSGTVTAPRPADHRRPTRTASNAETLHGPHPDQRQHPARRLGWPARRRQRRGRRHERGRVEPATASAASRRGSQNEGYAIPIEDAVAIAKKIVSGDGGDNIHVGATAPLLGVEHRAGLAGNGPQRPLRRARRRCTDGERCASRHATACSRARVPTRPGSPRGR